MLLVSCGTLLVHNYRSQLFKKIWNDENLLQGRDTNRRTGLYFNEQRSSHGLNLLHHLLSGLHHALVMAWLLIPLQCRTKLWWQMEHLCVYTAVIPLLSWFKFSSCATSSRAAGSAGILNICSIWVFCSVSRSLVARLLSEQWPACCSEKTPTTLTLFLCRPSTSLQQQRSVWTPLPPFMTQLQLIQLLWTPKIPVSRSNCQRTRSNGWIRASECLKFWELLTPIAAPYWSSSLTLPNRNYSVASLLVSCPGCFMCFKWG